MQTEVNKPLCKFIYNSLQTERGHGYNTYTCCVCGLEVRANITKDNQIGCTPPLRQCSGIPHRRR